MADSYEARTGPRHDDDRARFAEALRDTVAQHHERGVDVRGGVEISGPADGPSWSVEITRVVEDDGE